MKAIIKHHFDAWGYQAFKYLIYLLLAYNLVLFYQEESLASEVTFAAGFSLANIVEAFSATVDTAAWVLLLLLFELETYTIEDEQITGWTKRAMHGFRVFCYFFIVYALYGYIVKLGLTFNFSTSDITDLCSINGDWKYMETLNEYVQISKQNCADYALTNGHFLTHGKFNVISNADDLFMTQALAWVDVINATAWLVVVMMLEYDVRVQLGQYSSLFWEKYSRVMKGSVYLVLFVASVYWGFEGNFVDFWDSFLWLVAFFLIELNIFEWQADIAEEKQLSVS
ncbi:hypothetical protein RI845_01645 [Thalassotalea nanhaiensis]|uniref:Shikimate kinase n=1 Tax=Thalassotalea nanhaiensis TaxID=3065648 RepID=A0ABY9TM82_9GAMM|nr:hypothetical protein RI845_01645 [Colwelliaceae bacterium SQ345]